MAIKNCKMLLVMCAAFGLLWAVKPAEAHHSFAAEFDSNRSVTIEGVITKVDWINPHGWIHMDVTNKDGQVEHWDIQTESPSALRKAGMNRENMGKPGEKVKVLAYGAKDGTKYLAIVRVITYENGLVFRMIDDFTR